MKINQVKTTEVKPTLAFSNSHESFFQKINDPVIVVEKNRIIFHNVSADILFHQYNIENIDGMIFSLSLDNEENSFITFDIGLKLPIQTWQDVSWMRKPALLIFLKKKKRRDDVVPLRKKVTSTLYLDSNQETVMYVKIGLDGFLISANENYCKIHQLNRNEISSQKFTPLTLQIRDNGTIEEFLQKNNHLQQPYVFEHHLLTEDNDHYWEEWSILPIYNQNLKLVGLQAIGQDITESKWNEEVQKTIYNISHATVRENRLDDIFRCIQHELNMLMPAENMYIALADYEKNQLYFPFFVDQYDPPPAPKSFGHGLTDHVLLGGKSILISDFSNDEVFQNFGFLPEGAASVDWLGCPLKYNQETIGVIAAQTYDINTRYNKRQVEFLELISNQIALSIIRKRTEESLREKEEKYRALFESSQDAIFLEDRQGKIIEANDAASHMYGYSKEELVGLSIFQMMPKKMKTTATQILRIERNNDTSEYEALGIRKNGEVFPNLVKSCKIRIQDEDHIVVTIRDVLNVRKNEEQIQLQSTILGSIANAVFITDPEGIITWVNDAFTKLTGYEFDEVFGKKPNILSSGMQDQKFYQFMWSTIQKGNVWRGEIINRNRNGNHYYEEMTITPVFDQEGLIKHYVAIKQNITERKRREQELEAIAAMSSALRNAVTQNEILQAFLGKLMEITQGGGAVISLIQSSAEDIINVSGVGEWENLTDQHIPKNSGISGYVIKTGEVYIDNDAKNNGLFYFPQALKNIEAIASAPLIMQEEIIGTLTIGMKKSILEEEIRLLLTMCNLIAGVIYRANLMDQVNKTYRATIQGWAHALEIREQEKKGHSQNVVNLTEALARRVGFNESEIEEIINGAYLHDIGKMGIPDDILFKPGKFTNEDWNIMRQHPVFARRLLENIPHLGKAIFVPYYHHEHWDGSGYPEGLAGLNIPLNARIFSIIDVWDALLTPRIYRPAWSSQQVIQYIYSQSGRLFDPALVDEFASMVEEMGLIDH